MCKTGELSNVYQLGCDGGCGCGGSSKLGNTPPVINWNTEPDTSADGRKVKWTSNDWISWHKKIAEKYGVARANEVTQQWWDRLAWNDTRKVSWWFDCAFYNYFRKAGGNWAQFVPSLVCTLDETAGKTIDAAGNVINNVAAGAESLSKGASNTAAVLKYAVPVVLILAIGGIAMYAHKNYIKGNKRVKAGNATI